MKDAASNRWPGSMIVLLNRIALGSYFALAGIAKLQTGISKFYKEQFLPLKPVWLPNTLGWPYGHALPVLEVLLGGLLILGLWTRSVAALIALCILSFTLALAQAGLFFAGPGAFHTNVLLMTLALLLSITGGGSVSVDRWRRSRRGRPGGK